MHEKRLSPEEFRALVRSKGWTYRALAERWGVTEGWVSKVANNPDRPIEWDDKARGIPVKNMHSST